MKIGISKYSRKKAGQALLLLGGIFWLLSSGGLNVKAESTQSTLSEEEVNQVKQAAEKIDNKIEDKQDELGDLEKKAEKYKALLDEKKRQKATLENQLAMVDTQIGKVLNDIDIIQEEINRNEREIGQIEANIQVKDQALEKRKNDLRQFMQLFYQIDENFSMEYLANKGNISEVFNQSEYLVQTSAKIEKLMKEVEAGKKVLEEEKGKFEGKKKELEEKKGDLSEKNAYLKSDKVGKQILIEETKGEEMKYQKMLSRIEEQKQDLLGDIDDLSEDKRSELKKIQSDADKPKEGASTSWYYSQKDDRWGYSKIGMSSSLMKDYGCAISSVAMVFTFYGEKVTPGKLAKEKIFRWDLIVWPRTWGDVKLTSSISHGNINWSEVDKQLKKGNPVILFVKSSNSRAGHYVVAYAKDKKDYIVNDPLFGPNIYLETTRKLVGSIYNSATKVDQMIIYEKD